jgi:hypothetical protein
MLRTNQPTGRSAPAKRWEAKTPAGSAPFTVPIDELLNQSFVSRHTRFATLDDFLSASHLDPDELKDIVAPTRGSWDVFVRSVSRYSDASAMLREAGAEWIFRRIGLLIDA